MKWHYDVNGAEPILRDHVIYHTTDILAGVPMQKEVITTELNQFALLPAAAATVDNIVGVTAEAYDYSEHKTGPGRTGANGITAVATGVSNYLKIIINPSAVYLAEYSQLAADDETLTVADTTGKTVEVAAFTTDRHGDWVYITPTGGTTGGAGNLFQIGADAGGTTVATACTSYDDNLKGNIVGDTAIWVYNAYNALAASGSLNLATNLADVSGTGDAGTGALLVIQSYISQDGVLEPLRVERHSGTNYPHATTRLYSDVMFIDHIMGTNPRIIA